MGFDGLAIYGLKARQQRKSRVNIGVYAALDLGSKSADLRVLGVRLPLPAPIPTHSEDVS